MMFHEKIPVFFMVFRRKAKEPEKPAEKRLVTWAQVFSLLLVVYVFSIVYVTNAFSVYLYNDGQVYLILLYVPLGVTFFLYWYFLRFVFKKTSRPQESKEDYLQRAQERYSLLTERFFPPGTVQLMATRELRPELAKVHGDLIVGSEIETRPFIEDYLSIRKPSFIAACGDVISSNLMKTNFHPDVMVVDGMNRRDSYNSARPQGYEVVQTTNVTGGITIEAWNAIAKTMMMGTRTIIEVNGGEEDLLVIPLVLFSPPGSIVAYGQPPVTDLDPPVPAGAVMVAVTPRVVEKFKEILARFERCPGRPDKDDVLHEPAAH